MKYVSLIGIMALYANYAKEFRGLRSLAYEMSSRAYEHNKDYALFIIETGTEDENGQAVKTLRFREDVNRRSAVGYYTPASIIMPPILEIEWMRAAGTLPEVQMDVLEQVGYTYIIQILSWADRRTDENNHRHYYEMIEGTKGIVEAEEVADAPVILSAIEKPQGSLQKVKSWNTVYLYGDDFNTLLTRCLGQTQRFKELYIHIPLLLSVFLVEKEVDGLSEWTKTERLAMENELQELVRESGTYTPAQGGTQYTYGGCVSITRQDIQLHTDVFNIIYAAIHEQNTNMGLISYSDYSRVKGPDVIKASVRLSSLIIDWSEVLERAEQEKKAAEEAEAAAEG